MTDGQSAIPAPVGTPPDDEPKGIGGWLILPMIQLAFTAILTLKELLVAFGDPQTREGLTMAFQPGLPDDIRGMLYFGLADSLLGVAAIVLSALCFMKIVGTRRSVPLWMTAFYAFTTLCYGYEWLGFANLPIQDESNQTAQSAGQFIGAAIRAAIFISYFWTSKRVKNTFVN